MEAQFLSAWSLSLALIVGLILAIILKSFKCKPSDDRRLPPGPRGFKALQGLLQVFWNGNLVDLTEEWAGQYGDFVLCSSVLGNVCILNSARLVRKLFTDKVLEAFTNYRFKYFGGWYAFYNFSDVSTGSTHLHPQWPKTRKLFFQALKFYGDGVQRSESEVQAELRRLVTDLKSKEDQDVNFHDVISNSILRIMLSLITGESPEKPLVKLAKRLDELVNDILGPLTDTVLSACPWVRFLPFLPYRKLCVDIVKCRDDFMNETFTKCKTTFIPGQPRGIIDVLLDQQLKAEYQWITDDNIRAILLDIISAAYLTSTHALKSIFLYLVHNPDVMRGIQKEIDDNIGKQTPRLQDRTNFPFTEAVILETLRMSSPVPLSLPHLTSQDVTLDGYTVPKGSQIFSNSLAFQNDPELFPEPSVFRPERFLDDKGHLLPATHPLRESILPFGIGKRSCPGENFARSRIFLYVTTLLQQFDILPPVNSKLLPADCSSVEYDGLVSQRKPYKVIFRVRSEMF